MLDNEPTGTESGATDTSSNSGGDSTSAGTTTTRPRRRRAASRPAGPPAPAGDTADAATAVTEAPVTEAPGADATATGAGAPAVDGAPAPAAKKATRKRTTKKAAAAAAAAEEATPVAAAADLPAGAPAEGLDEPPTKPARRTRKKATAPRAEAPVVAEPSSDESAAGGPTADQAAVAAGDAAEAASPAFQSAGVLFQAPETTAPPARRTRKRAAAAEAVSPAEAPPEDHRADTDTDTGTAGEAEAPESETTDEGGPRRRRRGGRGRRGRGRAGEGNGESEPTDEADETEQGESQTSEERADEEESVEGGTRRRRRRRRRGADDAEGAADLPPNTVVRVREPRKSSRAKSESRGDEDNDGVRSVRGSTRLEAKKQRRREGREAGRRRPSIITEAEFLARRESVHRTMIVRQNDERTQIAVLEDGVLVEHYVSSATSSGLVGNVYLGKVQNVLPSMEAAFVDVGKGRNAVLYAGEVNWDAAGLEGQPKRIEVAMKSGDAVLVQVTKDSIGHKGARLTSQISLAGRYLVYVPNGSMTGISRKLPDTERSRLKAILKKVVPEGAGVIVRTAAEGASEEELARDVTRLAAQWEDIEKKAAKSTAPALLYGEPDMTIRVVRDIFNEDFAELIVSGDEAWDMLDAYVGHVAPDLADRMSRWTEEKDVFAANRVDEQLAKALDRKVWLPSGGYLVIDRTEAMIVVDVNTGKFTGAGGNLEETVTKNNLEAAEEIVRQLRLRDLGGIIVIDFIDMVLESNRDLVLRRLTECLGRDRTKHQVAEVTSLGLVQMTRKRVGQGLHEAFSETCEHCNGRGFHIRSEPVEAKASGGNGSDGGKGRGRGRGGKGEGPSSTPKPTPLSLPKPEPVAALTDGYRTEADPVAAEPAVAAEQPAEPEVAGEHVAEPEPSVPAAAAVAVVTPVATPVSELTADEQAQLAEAEAPATAPRARRRRRATG